MKSLKVVIPIAVVILAWLGCQSMSMTRNRAAREQSDAHYKEFDQLAAKLWKSDLTDKEAEHRLRAHIQVVFDAIHSPDRDRSRRAVELLAYLRPPGAARALVDLTNSGRSSDKILAWAALHDYVLYEDDPKSLELVRHRAEYQIQHVEDSADAVVILRAIGDPRSVPVLKQALSKTTDPDFKMLLKLVIEEFERRNSTK